MRSLEPGGRLHVATDWEDYAHHIMAVLSAQAGIENTAGAEHFAARPAYRPPTRYEARGAALGHRVYDIVFAKQGDEATRR